MEEVKALAKAIDLPSGSIAVRAKRFQGQHPDLDLGRLAAEVGGLLAKDRKVDLSHPDVDVRILIRIWPTYTYARRRWTARVRETQGS